MAKINRANTAANGSNDKRVLRIVLNDQSKRYVPNPNCCAVLACTMPDWMPPRLYYKMVDALRGHSKGMATLMTENLIGFMSGQGRLLTGISHVDDQLLELYRIIYDYASENGYEFNVIPF